MSFRDKLLGLADQYHSKENQDRLKLEEEKLKIEEENKKREWINSNIEHLERVLEAYANEGKKSCDVHISEVFSYYPNESYLQALIEEFIPSHGLQGYLYKESCGEGMFSLKLKISWGKFKWW